MKIFVYGTLLSGCSNYHILNTAKLLGNASTSPKFTMFHLGHFPAIASNGTTAIQGEIYEVDAEVLQRLDRLEGHPRFYQRSLITLTDGTEAWAYLRNAEDMKGMPTINSGNWREAASGRRV